MKDFEETKSFNIEDINIEKKELNSKISLETEQIINAENIDNEEALDELDEIVMEQEEQGAREEDEDLVDKEETNVVDEISMEEIDRNQAVELDEVSDELNLKEELSEASLEDIVQNDFQEKTIISAPISSGNKIGIASDHRGYKLKQKLTNYLNKKGYNVVDYGTNSTDSVDYPEFGFKLGEAVANCEISKGIAICGSGIGISIACNKIKGVRCAKVDNAKEVRYSRQDNDANVVAIAADMSLFRAKDVIDAFINTPFSGLERHQKRIDMLNNRG